MMALKLQSRSDPRPLVVTSFLPLDRHDCHDTTSDAAPEPCMQVLSEWYTESIIVLVVSQCVSYGSYLTLVVKTAMQV